MKPAELFQKIGSEIQDASPGNLFGKPCFKINGKAFICFFEDALVCKLDGNELKSALSLKGAENFDPSKKGRPMKAWVQIPHPQHKKWSAFAKMASDFVKAKSN